MIDVTEYDAGLALQAKRLMRRQFRGQRASLPGAAAASRSAAVCQALLALAELRDATSVALFWPIEGENEVHLGAVDRALRAAGKTPAYPAMIDGRRASMCFRSCPLEALVERGHRFPEPPPDAAEVTELDVIVVPGLAFDGLGYRLGYGGGHYDRTLPLYDALAVGAAFDFQLAADLPRGPHDVPVKMVVTDKRVLVPR